MSIRGSPPLAQARLYFCFTVRLGEGLPMADAALSRFTNRLVREKSPYLRQHARNPVDWFPWGEEAAPRPTYTRISRAGCR